jgi:hypothetical protein
MKTCTKCGETKPLEAFRPHKTTKDGLTTYCKQCLQEGVSDWRRRNKDKMGEYDAAYREKNRERIRSISKKWREKHRGSKNADTAKRHADKMKRTPLWLTTEEKTRIKCYYQLAQMRNRESGQEWHVDHVVPMRGSLVCGLHVPWNLQVIPATDNLTKNKRFEVD